MKATTKAVSNEEILKSVQDVTQSVQDVAQSVQDVAQSLQDFMQMTSESLDRLDRNMENVVERLDGVEGEVRALKGEVHDLKQVSYRHELQIAELAKLTQSTYDEQLNMHIDINEILHRIIALEKRPKLTKAELHELQKKLQHLINWAKAVAQKEGIPLKLS